MNVRRRCWLFGLGGSALVAAALGLAASDPVAFQKVAALTETPDLAFAPMSNVDVVSLVGGIPDRGTAGAQNVVYDVLPERKHRRTIVEGWGNCSNLVFGMAFELRRQAADYEIVHFLPRDTYLDGNGHTVIRTRFPRDSGPAIGLVDVVGRAVPKSGGRPLDISDLGRGDIEGLTFEPLGVHDPHWERFYSAEFQRGVIVGRITASSVNRYFQFLEASYVDLGLPVRLEKVVYDGAATVLGLYPKIHVESLAEARGDHITRFLLLGGSLWVLRIVPVTALVVVVWSSGGRLIPGRARTPES